MASNTDLVDVEYLSPSFDPASLTIPKLRSIFVEHNIPFPASAKKPQLIDIFTHELVPRSRKILAARERVKRTSRGITDMPSSQEGTVNGDEDDDTGSMRPPPLPHAQKRKSRHSSRTPVDDGDGDRVSSSRKRSSKHARSSDTEADLRAEVQQPPSRRNRRSETTLTLKVEEPDNSARRPPIRSSAFSDENPFQSGSSPLAATETRRKSAVSGGDRRKSTSKRRKTTSVPSTEVSTHKQEDSIVVPSSQRFDVSPASARNTRIKQEQTGGLEAGEEFSPEETLELVRERARNGERDILPPRRKQLLKPSLVPRSAPWVILTSLLAGYALWFRQEKFAEGYCGVGRPSTALSNVQLPEWASFLQPTCESCPPHAYCYEGMETRCEKDFVLSPHPLSLSGIVPIPPTCEPDGEKVRRVKAVADRAVEELRDRNAKWECGTLVDEKGKSVLTAEVDTQDLKSAVVRKRRRGMSEDEFEDLWKEAIGEIMTREDVSSNGPEDASSAAPPSPASPSSVPSDDPSDLRWHAIESALSFS